MSQTKYTKRLRTIECLNACAGLANPAAIQHVIAGLPILAEERTETGEWARKMLADLGGFTAAKEVSDASH